EAYDLVAPALRLDELRSALVELQQPFLIGRQTEEIAFFFHPFDRRARRCEFLALLAEGEFRLVKIGLVPHRVPAGVSAEIDVLLAHPAPQFLGALLVPRL